MLEVAFSRMIFNMALCLCRSKYTVEKIPESRFHMSEDWSHKAASAMASYWNSTVNDLKTLCCGNDWSLFLKVIRLNANTHIFSLMYFQFGSYLRTD